LRLRQENALPIAASAVAIAVGMALIAAAWGADPAWFDDHWLENYCPVSRITPVMEIVARALFACSGVALIAARSKIARWVGRRRALARTSATSLLAIGLALVVSDGVLRWHAKRKPRLEDQPILPPMTLDATGNYVPLPRRTKDVVLSTRGVQYAIDADGNRSASAEHVADRKAPTVLFGGESLTLGFGVAYENTYPALVGAALGVQSVNLAVTGFANDQEYLRVRGALAEFERPLAVVMLAIPSQLVRNVGRRRDRLALVEGRLEIQPAATSLFVTSPLRELLGLHSSEAIPLTRAIFRAMAEAATARGARALFVWTNFGPPCLRQDPGESPLEASLFAGLAVEHVRVEIPAEQTIEGPKDWHPNEEGHVALARAILAALGPKNPL